ncbi:tetratricopeptide repeat protein [candidate division KSB1 bacterium]|nr:tetratricopeptide repeat protein [candidate division KSB1 bacterium]
MKIIISEKFNPLIIISLLMFFPSLGFSVNEYWVPKYPPKAHYEIRAKIDTLNNMINGNEIITVINNSVKDISVLTFNWSISSESEISISLNGEILSLLNMDKNETESFPLIYALNTPIKPGENVQLNIDFSSTYQTRDTKEIKLIGWYPRLFWDGIYTFDSYKIKLEIPDDFAVAISGRFNKKTGYYENNGVRTCGIYLCKDLLTEQKEVGDVVITSLYTNDGSECAKLCLNTAVDVVKYYKDWLGFYPFKFLYIIPGADKPMGGYPFASGIVVIHGQQKFQEKPLLHWQWITAHEIGHQYWGEYVFDEDDSWLWIGLGVYADREYSLYRNLGTEKHTNMMMRYINGIENNYNTTADLTASEIRKIDFDYNNVIKHGKGVSIISALECVLGKDIFVRIYKRCLDEYAGKYLDYHSFWRICEEESGEDLTWFFDQWVRSNKYLSYSIVDQKCEQEKDRFVSHIKVKCHGTLKMPIPVKALFEDGSSQTQFTNRLLETNHLQFESKSKLKEAVIDPNNRLAMIKDTLFASHGEILENISVMSWTNAQEKAIQFFSQATEIKLRDYNSWFKLGMVLVDSRNYVKALQCFQKTLEIEPKDFISFVWLGHLNDLKGEREEALKYYQKALENDDGGTYQHSQFGLFVNRKWVEERLLAPFIFE